MANQDNTIARDRRTNLTETRHGEETCPDDSSKGAEDNGPENLWGTRGLEGEAEKVGTGSEKYTILLVMLCIQNEAVQKWRKRLVVPTACVIINILAGVMYSLPREVVAGAAVTFQNPPTDALEALEIKTKIQNIYRVFFSLGAASCAPLVIKCGFRKSAVIVSALLILSLISSSMTTTFDVIAFTFCVIGGTALGLLRSIGLVATLDYLDTRPMIGLLVSYLCYTIGSVISLPVTMFGINIYFQNGKECPKWPQLLAILAIVAHLGVFAGGCLHKKSKTQQNVPRVFKHPPFHILLTVGLVTSLGTAIAQKGLLKDIQPLIINIVTQIVILIILFILRKFYKERLKNNALISFGIQIFVVGFITGFQEMMNNGALNLLAVLLGSATAFSQIMLPLALTETTGKANSKLVLPLLEGVRELGDLIGSIEALTDKKEGSSPDEGVGLRDGALYYACVSLIVSGTVAIVCWYKFKTWPTLEGETVAEPFRRAAKFPFTSFRDIRGMMDGENDNPAIPHY